MGQVLRGAVSTEGGAGWAQHRIRVDGKFLARGRDRLRLQGVTYGPFAPNERGEPFPEADRVRRDFEQMRSAKVNAVRTYYVPPDWFLDLADEQEMHVLIDVPWSKHLCFLDSRGAQQEARDRVRQAAERGRDHACVAAYSIGNEIPTDIVRWHGARRIEGLLSDLADVSRQTDPEGLVTYGSYPPTEYLDLSFLDFLTFNVYLHEPEAFRRYLFRLQNLAGDKPLVLGEIGMDTLRYGEAQQAEFLANHMREVVLMGTAGAFVFSWTDDWHTGGHQIEDWAFGITRADRSPKPSYHALQRVFGQSPAELLEETPRVSVAVCSYNGASTLPECLESLCNLDYPDYEVILVDDGSKDETREIAGRFAGVRYIAQSNRGLSVARNVALEASTGSIIAYTDSDCFADRDWLSLLVHRLESSHAAAVGGPNLTPEDGRLASCVAASPGQPTHVLEDDQVAEHIPGCNMAFRRAALEAIGGFDPLYRKAGDDVDVCWRLQDAGRTITFAPGAFVWHHRRQSPRAYLRQQAGYGEAEALLQLKHPRRFNGRGDSKWRGRVYGVSWEGVRLSRPVIYRGTFGSGLFQRVYHPDSTAWALLPSTLEWQVAAATVGVISLLWPPAWLPFAGMLGLSLASAGAQAAQARLSPKHEGLMSRLLIAALCYAQPLARSWARYRARLSYSRTPTADPLAAQGASGRLSLCGARTVEYWTEEWRDRTELLDQFVAHLDEYAWPNTVDPVLASWDLHVHCHPWTAVNMRTVQEDHGSGRRLVRVRYRLRLTRAAKAILLVGGAVVAAGLSVHPVAGGVAAGLLGAALLGVWRRGARLAAGVVAALDGVASRMGFTRFDQVSERSESRLRRRARGRRRSAAHVDERLLPADVSGRQPPAGPVPAGDGFPQAERP